MIRPYSQQTADANGLPTVAADATDQFKAMDNSSSCGVSGCRLVAVNNRTLVYLAAFAISTDPLYML
jgi:hypothetical protein